MQGRLFVWEGKGGEGRGRFMIDGFVGAPYRPQGLAASLRQAQAGPGLAGAEGSAARGARPGSKPPYERYENQFAFFFIIIIAIPE